MKLRTTFCVLITVFVLLIGVTISDAQVHYMYWADHGNGTNQIRRANLDGTNVQDIVTGFGRPVGIALDLPGDKIYWTDRDNVDYANPNARNSIRRMDLDGTNIETLVTGGASVKEAIALDTAGGKMYWVDWNTFTGTGKIQRANLDGTNVEDVVSELRDPRGIALDLSRGKMYWTDGGAGKIQRANFDGSNIENLVTGVVASYLALDFSDSKIYWANWGAGKIQRANFDGSNVEDIVGGLGHATGIALDDLNGKIYWANWFTNFQGSKIQRANLDGSNVEDLVTGVGLSVGIALGIPQTPAGLRFSPNVIADRTLTVDTTVSFTLPIAIGGNPPYTYSISALPAGLEFDALSVQIHGTPTTEVSAHPVTYTVTDATGASASLTFTITVRDTLPPTDFSHIYWTDWEWGSTDWESGKIRRVNLDGTNIEDIVTGLDTPNAIALDVADRKMYWTSSDRFAEANIIQRANLDGTNIEDIVTGLDYLFGIALDVANRKMYWIHRDGETRKIQRANLDGTNIEDIITGYLFGIALDVANRKMYYAEYVSVPTGDGAFDEDVIIWRANLDGTNKEYVVRGAYGGDIALDVAGGKIYYHTMWISGESAQIWRANLDGTNDERIVTGYPIDIALDVANQKIYWVHDDDQTQKIQRANLDGTDIEDVIPTGLAHPTSIALGIPQVSNGLRFTPNTIADQTFTVGMSVSLSLPIATGGTSPYTYTLTPLPPAGLYFDAATPGLSGTPTTPMPATVYTYTATDAAAQTATLTFTMTVTDTGPGPGDNLDVNGDGQVNVLDLILVAVFYGTRGDGLPADVNADGIVNVDDFAAVAAGVDAAGALPLQAVEAALLAAAAQAGDIEAIAGAPISFNAHQQAWSKQIAYHNVATAFADVRLLVETGEARLGKQLMVLRQLLELLEEMVTTPETTALLPNYPNPFNPETWIPYHLATDADVTVTIYDVRGNVVRELMLGHQSAGVYESRGRAAYWDGRNALGEPVASGVYFWTLTAGDFTATRKLFIAK